MDTENRDTAYSEAEASASKDGQTDTRTPSVQDIRTQLAERIVDLRFVNSAMMVCVQALQQQDAEMDTDIALVLQRTVGDKLDETIDRIEAIALGIEYDEA